MTSTCGSRVIAAAASSASGAPGALHGVGEQDAGEQPVAGRREVAEDHVAALLAAERVAARVERLEHVAVADGGLDDVDPGRLHRQAEPEVRHHRDDDGVVAQRAAAMQVEWRRSR